MSQNHEQQGTVQADVELKHLTKSYDGDSFAVKDVNVTIKQGEFFVLVGPSGCGKSTMLRMIAGLEEITAGEMHIGGELANEMAPSERKLSMVFQNYALYPHLSVEENIIFGLKVRKMTKAERTKRCMDAAEMLGLTDYLKRKPRELSGGQRQRVALARAVVSQMPICLMDEPLSNLDAKLRAQMRAEIRELQQRLGITMIYVTHDQVEAMTMGDRMMVLNHGEVQQIGTPLELYNSPANDFVATFIGAPPMNLAEVSRGDTRHSFQIDGFVSFYTDNQEKRYKVGVRAEKLLLNPPAEEEKGEYLTVNTTVRHVEILGNETIVQFPIAGQDWRAKLPGQIHLKRDEALRFYVHWEDIHLFDSQSGKAVWIESDLSPFQSVTEASGQVKSS